MNPEDFYGWGRILIDDLPTYYHESDFMQQWLMALGFEFDIIDRLTGFFDDPEAQRALENRLPADLEPIFANWFVRTASGEALDLWEAMLGIPTDLDMTTGERRNSILVRLQDTRTPTPAFIKEKVLLYVDEVVISENFDLPGNDLNRYRFNIHILHPTGILPNVASAIDETIKRIKPSHLSYLIIYSEITWLGLGEMTWAELGDATWKTVTT